jgi:two-component system response regulator
MIMIDNCAEILLVEDSPDDAAMTIRALRKINLADKLIHVEDGKEALDYLFGSGVYVNRDLSKCPKVILLDIKMPRVDGIEVLRKIKSNEATRMIPVVIMTSSSEEKDMIETYHLGANSYVVKPMNFESFAQAVSELGLYWLLTNRVPNYPLNK